MSSQLVDLGSLFGASQGSEESEASAPPSDRIDLGGLFKTNEEARDDVSVGRYTSIFEARAKVEPPKRGIGKMIDDTITSVVGTNTPDASKIDQAGLARVKQEQAETNKDIQARRAELGTDESNAGMRVWDSAAAGLAGISGSTMEYIGRQFGIKRLEEVGKQAQVDAAALTPEDQNLLEKVATGIGSAAPLIAAGMATGGGALALGAGTGTAMTAASAVGAALEAPSIAQEAYEGALKTTGNETQAEAQGYKAAVLNLPLTFITNKLGFFGDKGGRIVQTAKTIGVESVEEGAQKGLTNYLGYQPTGEGVSEEALVGGLTGGVLKQFTYRPDSEEPKTPGKEIAKDVDGEGIAKTPGAPKRDEEELPEGVRLLSFDEVTKTFSTSPASAAVLFQDAATQEQKELVRRAVDRAGINEAFQQALGDQDLLNDTRVQMQELPEFTDSLAASLATYVNTMPPANRFKPEVARKRITEDDINAQMDQIWEDAGYRQAVEEDAAQAAAEKAERQKRRPGFEVAPPADQGIALPTQDEIDYIETQTNPVAEDGQVIEDDIEADVAAVEAGSRPEPLRDGITLTDQNRPGFEVYFGDVADRIASLPEGDIKTEAYNEAFRHMTDVGFTPSDATALLSAGTAQPSASGKSGLLDQVFTYLSVKNRDTEAAFQPAKVPAYFNQIAKAFGVDVVAYTYSGNVTANMNKAGTYMRTPRGRGLVAINMTQAGDGSLFVFGHEVFHDLERRFPAQAKQLAAEVKKYLSAERADVYAQYYANKNQAEKTDSEIAADLMGQMFTDRQFWQALANKRPTLVQRVLQVIDSVIAKFSANKGRMEIAKYVTDYEKVRDMLASFVADNVSSQGKPVETSAVESMDDGADFGKPQEATQKPAGDAEIVQQVLGLLQQKETGKAAKLFRENKLFEKGFGSFTDLQKQANQRVDTTNDLPANPVIFAGGKAANAKGKSEIAESSATVREEDGEPMDVAGVTFTAKPKAKTVKKAVAEDDGMVDTPRNLGLNEKFQFAKGTQGSLGLGRFQRNNDTPQQSKLRKRLDDIMRSATRIKFFDDTILLLQKQIADIDARMKEINRIQVDGKTFTARDETDERPGLWGIYDENAYDRFDQGLVPDKPTTKMELMAARRQLSEELTRVRENSIRSKASLFRRSMFRLMDQIMAATQNAISAGMDQEQARSVFRPYFEALSFREQLPPQVQVEAELDVDQDAQVDAFDGARAAMGVVNDYRSKLISSRELENLIERGVADGSFSYADVGAAFAAYKMSVPRGVMNIASQLSVRKRMREFLAENGNTVASRLEWLTNMKKVLSLREGSRNVYTAEELAFFDEWNAPAKALATRRKVTPEMRESTDVETAFPNLLFNRFTLDEIRQKDNLRPTLGDTVEAWFQDVAYALRRRPDLATQIKGQLGADLESFNDWIAAKKLAIAQESKVLAKVPAFAQLRNMDGPEFLLDSTPGVEPKEKERIYTQIANADLNELPSIMDAMSRLNAVLNGKVDPDTGEILTDEQADQYAADFIDSLVNKSMMSSAINPNTGEEMTQFGANLGFGQDAPAGLKRGEFGFGETVEQAGDAMRAAGPQNSSDLSTEEQLQEEMISEADLIAMGNQIDEELDEGTDAADGVEVAAEKQSSGKKAKVPDSLVKDLEYRFKHAPFSGEVTNSIVAEHILKITAKWANAPRVSVVPNVQMLPADIREKVMAKLGADAGAAGLFYGDQVFVFSDHITSLADAEFVLFHESYGHYGMRVFMGDNFDSFLERAYATNIKVREAADALMNEKPIGKLEAVDEVLSDMAAANEPVSLVKQWLGKVISGLRSIGLNKVAGWMSAKTDAEIGYTLMMARNSVVNGGQKIFNGAPSDVRLAEARLPYEMFSRRGGKTTAYARRNPITDTYAVFTATGEELRSGWDTAITHSFEEAMALMRKSGVVERRLRSGMYIDNKIPSDLQKVPDFRIAFEDINLMSKQGWKDLGRLIKRNSIIAFQNEYKAAFEVLDHFRKAGRIHASFDFAHDLDGIRERRTAALLEDFRAKYVEPLKQLVEEAGKLGAKYETIDTYLVARHAAERNKHIAKINPEMPDGGSGMKTADADAFLNSVRNEKFMPKLEEISYLLANMSNEKLTMLKNSGMISFDEFQRRAKYKNYVNLSGFKEGLDAFDDLAILAGSSKFSTRKDKRALGRTTMAADVLVRTIQSAEAAILNSEKNQVKRKILAMLEVNYDPDFVAINKQSYKRVLDENGEVTEKMDESYITNKNVMVVHVDGRPTTIEFKQTGKGTFADAVHGMIYPAQVESAVLRALGAGNRIVGQMLTTWNPIWSVINFARDAQTLYFNSVADGRVSKQMAAEMVKSIPGAMKAAFHYASNGNRGSTASVEWLRTLREMRESGGMTSFLNLRGLEKQVSEIENLLEFGDAEPNKVVKAGRFVADVLEHINIPIEVAPRLAAYKVMRDNGFSKAQAAQYAGEITVNFNMRGSSKFMRNWFLFFNPAVQGSSKLIRLAKNNPKVVGQIALGMAAVGFITSMIARAMGGEDEDGIDRIDKIPVFKRATSILLPNPFSEERFLAIPIPYGWNAFIAAGTFMADTLWAGTQAPGTTAKRIAQTAFESFSPVGGAGLDSKTLLGTAFKAAAPTMALPLVDLAFNENRFGAPIVKEAGLFGGGQRPNAEMAFDSASPISAGIFKGLNRATGGDNVNAGLIDVNPGVVDYLISSYVPGIGAETYKMASWATRQAMGYETNSASLPLVDRLTGKIPESYDYGMYRRAKEYVATKYDDFRLNPENRDAILAEFPGIGSAKDTLDATASRIQDLREYRKNVEKDSSLTMSERVKTINELRQREKEIVHLSVRTLLENSPEIKKVLIASE